MIQPQSAVQVRYLRAIKSLTEESGHAPSYRAIMARVGARSIGGVYQNVDHMVELGLLRKVGPQRRLEIISRVPTAADLARLSDTDLATLADRVDAECERRAA